MQVAALYGSGSAAVRPNQYRFGQFPAGQQFPQFPAGAAGFDRCNGSILNQGDNYLINVIQRTGRQGQAPDSFTRNGFQYHIEDIVAISKMMMKRNCHSVLQATGVNDCIDAFDAFVGMGHIDAQFGAGAPLVRLKGKSASKRG